MPRRRYTWHRCGPVFALQGTRYACSISHVIGLPTILCARLIVAPATPARSRAIIAAVCPSTSWRGHSISYIKWTPLAFVARERVRAQPSIQVFHSSSSRNWSCNQTFSGALPARNEKLPVHVAFLTIATARASSSNRHIFRPARVLE